MERAASDPVVRRKNRLRLRAGTQVVLGKGNRLWASKVAKAFACWRHSKDMRHLAFLSACEVVKHALKAFLRRALFGKLAKDSEKRRSFSRLIVGLERIAVGKVGFFFGFWAKTSAKTGENDYISRRRLVTFVTYMRQAHRISLRNSVQLWRQASVKDISLILQAQQLSAIKFRIAFTPILRKTMLTQLKSKNNAFWAVKRLEKSAKKYQNSNIEGCLAAWREEVEAGKSQKLVEMTIGMETIVNSLRSCVKTAKKTGFERWKELIPKYTGLRINGKRVKNRFTPQNAKNLTVFPKTTSKITAISVLFPSKRHPISPLLCFSCIPTLKFPSLSPPSTIKSDLKLLRRTFLTLSTSVFHQKMFAFDHWSTQTVQKSVLRSEQSHTILEIVTILQFFQKDRISAAFRALKVPKTVKKLNFALINIAKSYKFMVQKAFYRWNGSAKSIAALHQIAVFKLFSMAKKPLKRLFLSPILTAAGKKDAQKHSFLVLNRLLLREISRNLQKWSQKTTELRVLHLQEGMKNRRLKVLMLSWLKKDKFSNFQKFKSVTTQKSLKEKYLSKMFRLNRRKTLKNAIKRYQKQAKTLSKLQKAVKSIRKVTYRRLSFPILQLKRVPRPVFPPSAQVADSYMDRTMKTLRNSLDRSPLPKPSFFQTLFRG